MKRYLTPHRSFNIPSKGSTLVLLIGINIEDINPEDEPSTLEVCKLRSTPKVLAPPGMEHNVAQFWMSYFTIFEKKLD